jgi:cell division septation protein DedD
MHRIDGIEFISSENVLREAVGQETLPEALLAPLQALIKHILESSASKPYLIHLLSADAVHSVRDYFAHALMRALGQQVPSAIIVDCDFTDTGMNGIVPQKDALGFLDYLLYGSSLGVVAQQAPQGVRVIGAGSFPVSKKMPVSLDSFADAARRLAAQSRIVIFCSPARGDDENLHPISDVADLLMNVSYEKRFPVGRVDPFEEELAEKGGSPVISVRITSSGERIEAAPAPVADDVTEPSQPFEDEVIPAPTPEFPEPPDSPEPAVIEDDKKTKWLEEEAPRKPAFSGLPFEKKHSGSIWAKIIPAVIAIAVIGFLFWWFFITKPMQGTGEEAQLAAADTSETSGEPTGSGRAHERLPDNGEAVLDEDAAREAIDASPQAVVEADGGTDDDRTAAVIQPGTEEESKSTGPTEREREEPVRRGSDTPPADVTPADVIVTRDFTEYAGKYLVHVSSFREVDRAKEDAAYLLQNNFAGCVIPVDLNAKGRWYRVYAGPLDTREEALQQKIMLDELPRVKFTRITRAPGL